VEATLGRVAPCIANTLRGFDATLAPASASEGVNGVRFSFLRPHAQGGLGQVSVALDRELNREVALKEIRPEHADNLESRARFLLEAEVTGRLEHPGVVPVYGLGCNAEGRPFYAMRLVKGQSLKEAIEGLHGTGAETANSRDSKQWNPALRSLLNRFVAVCNAVAYAHDRGVIHRDLKPANILLGPYGETLVVDWGLAKVVGRDESAVSLRVLQFGDSMLPVGSFSFSNGLEAAVSQTVVQDVESLRQFVQTAIRQAARSDGIAVLEAFRAARHGDSDRVERADPALFNRKLNEEMRTMNVRMGRKLAEMVERVSPDPVSVAGSAR
jgi:serine/threonine protein kinase